MILKIFAAFGEWNVFKVKKLLWYDLKNNDICSFVRVVIFSMYLHCPDIWIFGMVSPAAEGSARPQYIDFKGNGLRAGYWQGIPTWTSDRGTKISYVYAILWYSGFFGFKLLFNGCTEHYMCPLIWFAKQIHRIVNKRMIWNIII